MDTPYPPPIDRLLRLGQPQPGEWSDYLALGLRPEQIPDLVRMARDTGLYDEPDDSPAIWAPLHAVRALGQLRSGAAIEPMVEVFHEQEESEWILDDLSIAFGMIGRAAIPSLIRYLAERSHGLYPRIAAANSLVEIAKADPEVREECVTGLMRQIEQELTRPEEEYEEDDYVLNAFLIGDLVKLEALEAAAVIERAFAEDKVDERVVGDWEEVQVELGLLPARLTPRPRFGPGLPDRSLAPPGGPLASAAPERPESSARAAKAKKKVKRNMARQSRKRNRPRKKR